MADSAVQPLGLGRSLGRDAVNRREGAEISDSTRSFTTHQHANGHNAKTSHLAHITPDSLSCSRRVTRTVAYRAHRHGSEFRHTRYTPGQPRVTEPDNPCNHLARQACGPWRTHRYNTYIQTRRQRRHEELKIHRDRRVAQTRRRGHHRAGGTCRGSRGGGAGGGGGGGGKGGGSRTSIGRDGGAGGRWPKA